MFCLLFAVLSFCVWLYLRCVLCVGCLRILHFFCIFIDSTKLHFLLVWLKETKLINNDNKCLIVQVLCILEPGGGGGIGVSEFDRTSFEAKIGGKYFKKNKPKLYRIPVENIKNNNYKKPFSLKKMKGKNSIIFQKSAGRIGTPNAIPPCIPYNSSSFYFLQPRSGPDGEAVLSGEVMDWTVTQSRAEGAVGGGGLDGKRGRGRGEGGTLYRQPPGSPPLSNGGQGAKRGVPTPPFIRGADPGPGAKGVAAWNVGGGGVGWGPPCFLTRSGGVPPPCVPDMGAPEKFTLKWVTKRFSHEVKSPSPRRVPPCPVTPSLIPTVL